MATLRSLKPSLRDLDYTEQIYLHEQVRVSRFVPKKARTKAIAKRKEKRDKKREILMSLSVEEAREMLKYIEGLTS